MSELKAFDITVAEEGYCEGIVKYRRAVYDKSEADKVIAELKAQKAQAEDDCAYWKMSESNAANAMHETEEYAMQLYKEARHQKYKRCLAMAKACREKSERMYCEASTAKAQNEILGKEPKDAVVEKFELWGAIASTHRKRWLELAEKFKEAE